MPINIQDDLLIRLKIWVATILIAIILLPYPAHAVTEPIPSSDFFEIEIDKNLWKSSNVYRPYSVKKPVVRKNRTVKKFFVKPKSTLKNYPSSAKQGSFRVSTVNNTYSWGHCTYYVKQKLSWLPNGLGNANEWLGNARRAGLKISSKPIVGSVMVTNEGSIGHVIVVEKIDGNNIYVSEMNYVGWNKVSKRVLDFDDNRILGYIYK